MFQKALIKLRFSDTYFWKSSFGKKYVVVQSRKYSISFVQDSIQIKREINDVFDLRPSVQLKRYAIAKGKIYQEEGYTFLVLSAGIDSFYNYLIISSLLLFGLCGLLTLLQNIIFGLICFMFIIVTFGISYFLINNGIKRFISDIEDDIHYFESK